MSTRMNGQATDTLSFSAGESRLERIPLEVGTAIATYLNLPSLARCRRVSKTLHGWAAFPLRRTLYVNSSSPTPDTLRAMVQVVEAVAGEEGLGKTSAGQEQPGETTAVEVQSAVTRACDVQTLVFDSDTYAQSEGRLDGAAWKGVEHVVIRGRVVADLPRCNFGALVEGLKGLRHLTLEGVGGSVIVYQEICSTVDYLTKEVLSRMTKLQCLELKCTSIDLRDSDWPPASKMPEARTSELTVIADVHDVGSRSDREISITATANFQVFAKAILEPLARDAYGHLVIRCHEAKRALRESAFKVTIERFCPEPEFASIASELRRRTRVLPTL